MELIAYHWNADGQAHVLQFVFVPGTQDCPYSFGDRERNRQVEIRDFFISTTPVTQALWAHVTKTDVCAAPDEANLPVINVSWDDITRPLGFLDRINQGPICTTLLSQLNIAHGQFRLPTETEWEYAARGGPHWADGFCFSGSNEVEAVAWHERKHGDHRQPIAQKAPNQLGLYDMSGNVWEWCQDVFTPDLTQIPQDGQPYTGPSEERVLRGGCFHNWAIHCTVSKRYAIGHQYKDECIGFRLAFSLTA